MPKDKGDPIFPQRWQDWVTLAIVWTIIASWFGAGTWLLRRALRPHA